VRAFARDGSSTYRTMFNLDAVEIIREPGTPLLAAIRSTDANILQSAIADPGFTGDLALVLLKRHDLPRRVLKRLSETAGLIKSRKVKLAVLVHPRAPVEVSLLLLRQLFPFELMQVTLAPAALAQVRAAAENILVGRLATLPAGVRLAMARRATGRVIEALLLDPDLRVVHAVLDNPRLTESPIAKALLRNGPPVLVEAVNQNPKWQASQEIRRILTGSTRPDDANAEDNRHVVAGEDSSWEDSSGSLDELADHAARAVRYLTNP